MTVDVTIWPDSGAVPTGYVRGEDATPFVVLYPLGGAARSAIQTSMSMPVRDQALYLRALAELATRLADELDPQDGATA